MILLILRGVPASGKSTHALELQKQGWTVVNRDSIRFALYGAYWGKGINEDVVTDVENKAIESALASNANVVVDATNLNKKALKAKLSLASRYGAQVAYRDFEVPLMVAVARDKNRERQVGWNVISKNFFTRYKINVQTGKLPGPPDLWPKFKPYEPVKTRPMVYIVDTDGTVADHEGVRNPYDTSKYHLDKVHWHTASVVKALSEAGYGIIGLSGRDEKYAAVTTKWWNDNGIPFDEFYMRSDNDKRVDAVIKYELFKKWIAPTHFVLGAFDDRPQVIRMWRSIGVPVFDVGNGIEF